MNILEEFNVPSWDSWKETALKALGEKGFNRLIKDLGSGVTANPLYAHQDTTYPRALTAHGPWEIQAQYQYPIISKLSKILEKDLQGGVQKLNFQVSPNAQKGLPLYNVNSLNTLLSGVFLEAVTTRFSASIGLKELFHSVNTYYYEKGAKVGESKAELSWTPHASENSSSEVETIAEFFKNPQYFTKLINFSGAQVVEAGGDGVQELGFLVSSILETLKNLNEKGVNPSDVIEKSTITFALGTDLFYDVAKIRAAKLILKQLFAELELPVDIEKVSFIGEEVRRYHTKTDPWVNILRSTVSGLSAGLAGVQAIQLLPYDSVYGVSELGLRVSRNIHHILMEESHIHRVQDPTAGSEYIESLTQNIAENSWKKFQIIQGLGGLNQAIASGSVQADITESLTALNKNLRTRRKPITGTSEFPHPTEKKPEFLSFTDSDIETQKSGIPELTQLSSEPNPLFQNFRESEIFEALREKGEQFSQTTKVFLLNIGTQAEFTPRASFAKNILGIAGLVPTEGKGGSEIGSLVSDFASSQSKLVYIAGTDEHYDSLISELVPKLKDAGATHIVLAQNPKDKKETYQNLGINGFVHIGCDVVESLETLLGQGGK